MANYQTSQDLVNGILSISGELTDGTSGYQADALTYLNLAYRGVLTGGNIFGIDVADPWPWAIAKRPIAMTLQPSIQTLTVSVNQESYNLTFNTAPTDPVGNTISVNGWWMKIDPFDDWFRIVQHIAGTTTAQIDAPFTEANQTNANCNLILLDYDLFDNTILVTQYNQFVDFTEGGGSLKTATLTQGIYSPSAYATMVNEALAAAGTLTYTGSWNVNTRLFTWAASNVFNILNVSGPNATLSASAEMGLDVLDYTGSSSYVAQYPLNAITRLTSPMLCYRKPNTPWRNPKNEGKIYELSLNKFNIEYPFTMMQSGTPDKFCVTNTSKNGIVSVRMNSYFYNQQAKVEVGYIPRRQLLQNNAISIPVVPEEHRKYLVDAAASMLMHDKTDSKRTEREAMAKAGLQALQHSTRKELGLNGINYAKLIPRYGATQKRWWWQIT